jgi:superfamily II DNA or RNA helicase
VLALTATPDERTDGMDKIVEYHLGPNVLAIEIPNFNIAEIAWKGNVELLHYKGPEEFTQNLTNKQGWVSVIKMCKQFIADPYRNELILQNIIKLYNAKKNVFIFSELRDYLFVLQKKISALGLIAEIPEDAGSDRPNASAHTLMGGSTIDDKKNAAQNARIILITYGYGMQSISIPKMDAIMFVTPRRNKMRQTIGRILRRSGDTTIERIIIDLIDQNTKLKSQLTTRKQVYKEKNFTLKKTIVNYTDISIGEVYDILST